MREISEVELGSIELFYKKKERREDEEREEERILRLLTPVARSICAKLDRERFARSVPSKLDRMCIEETGGGRGPAKSLSNRNRHGFLLNDR